MASTVAAIRPRGVREKVDRTVFPAYARHLGFFPPRPIMEAMARQEVTSRASELSDEDQAYLECEREHWGPGGVKQEIVERRFAVSIPVYYQRLYRICHSAQARRYDPVLVRRILEVADEVSTQRLGKMGVTRG